MQLAERETYESAYYSQEGAPLYGSPWWLDSTCGPHGWETYTIKDHENTPLAYIPYHKTLIRGMNAIINPPMSQWLPVIKAGTNSKNIPLADFFNALPSFSILDVSFKKDSGMLLPGIRFPVHSKYSHLIDASQTKEKIKSHYNEGLRRNLREGGKKYSIEQTSDIDTFIKLCHSTYQHRNIKSPAWLEAISPDVFNALMKHQSGRIEFASHNGRPVAGIMTGWDKQTSYYLLGGRTGDEEGTSGHAFLLDHAIMKAHDEGRCFDFEGSMHPGIASFFQSFGANPEAYWQIKKFRGLGKVWSILHK